MAWHEGERLEFLLKLERSMEADMAITEDRGRILDLERRLEIVGEIITKEMVDKS